MSVFIMAIDTYMYIHLHVIATDCLIHYNITQSKDVIFGSGVSLSPEERLVG